MTAPSFDDLPLMSFDEASEAVLAYLQDSTPMRFWAVTRQVGDRQVTLSVHDDVYGIEPGESHLWSDSLCEQMIDGRAPHIAPDAMAVSALAGAAMAQAMTIGSYIGLPIRDADGELFGTLCGLDPLVQDVDLHRHARVLGLLSTLLGQILQAESLRQDARGREAELRWRAFHDDLTRLPNRAMFVDRLEHALNLHRRDSRPLAVLLFDVDDFKAVNDRYGHAAGDSLLERVAERLRGCVRPGDTLARLGGDEFAVLLEDGGDPTVPAARILDALREPVSVDGTDITVAVSVGVALLPADAGFTTVDVMLSHADIAMYSAKRAGKGRLAVYEPVMRLPEAMDLQLREPLRRAITSGDLRAHYQPIVTLETGEVVAYEALARWTNQGEVIGPDVFIPVAARSGLLPTLTDTMLEHACHQLAAWSAEVGHDRLRVAVNVPPGLISDATFPAHVSRAIAQHGLAAHQLVLEITEDALLTDLDKTRAVTTELRQLGVNLSLDDFGTGYSSLLHLRRIPLDSLKIDRGFTNDVDTNPDTERFMRALLTLGRDLDLRVIVEGVERQSQADVLRRLGCTHAQGFFFGRPGPGPDVGPAPTPGRLR